ncbi:MAG: hypothetical protein JSS40_12725 [Proteobacteria bacterium]|nr:hypothetical protein [Pseudomonadota bacterium]
MQTYANLCLIGALGAYCFNDTGGKAVGKALTIIALLFLAAFVVTEGISMMA